MVKNFTLLYLVDNHSFPEELLIDFDYDAQLSKIFGNEKISIREEVLSNFLEKVEEMEDLD